MRITLREKKRKLSAKVIIPKTTTKDILNYTRAFERANLLKSCPFRVGDKVYD